MINILRLNHRIERDKRLTMHVALAARAFGAHKLYYSGQRDKAFEDSVRNVVKNFGGNFEIEFTENPIKLIESKKKDGFKIVHLTAYGVELSSKIDELRNKDVLAIVGGEKVAPEFYKLSDCNISVTNQPHSEVSALAIFLYEYFNRKKAEFNKAKKVIVPSERGKVVKS
ncbi:MAG: tRNA (cytidine(56)-2'-O)-methyltransferase [Nanoarchaeota archaeon]